ncbi:hypothetical protein [Kiloniella sp. b19]|uniref:hypothetical protein n=1 Tax=Kiloniella sp. GXU_MW_B19 TaxID=3141326 RepID=UPI0031E183AF
MKLTSSVLKELLLSLSFLLDRVTPSLLYFLSFFLVVNHAVPDAADAFSIYYSAFNSFVALALGFTTSVKYFSARSRRDSLLPELVFLCLLLGGVASALFLLYADERVPVPVRDVQLKWLFVAAILLVACFYFVSSLNEGRLRVAGNNRSNAMSVIVFPVCFLIFEALLQNVLYSVCYGFVVTRAVMLLVIVANSGSNLSGCERVRFELVGQILLHGLPITLLFFVQKYIQTEALIRVSDAGGSASLFQMILTIALLFNLLGNAVSTNGFIRISRDRSRQTVLRFLGYSMVLCLCAFGVLWLSFETGDGVFWKMVIVSEVLQAELFAVKTLVLVMAVSEMLFVIAALFSRGMGDNWRIQLIWVSSVVAVYSVAVDTLSIQSSCLVFAVASCLSFVFGLAFVFKRAEEQ